MHTKTFPQLRMCVCWLALFAVVSNANAQPQPQPNALPEDPTRALRAVEIPLQQWQQSYFDAGQQAIEDFDALGAPDPAFDELAEAQERLKQDPNNRSKREAYKDARADAMDVQSQRYEKFMEHHQGVRDAFKIFQQEMEKRVNEAKERVEERRTAKNQAGKFHDSLLTEQHAISDQFKGQELPTDAAHFMRRLQRRRNAATLDQQAKQRLLENAASNHRDLCVEAANAAELFSELMLHFEECGATLQVIANVASAELEDARNEDAHVRAGVYRDNLDRLAKNPFTIGWLNDSAPYKTGSMETAALRAKDQAEAIRRNLPQRPVEVSTEQTEPEDQDPLAAATAPIIPQQGGQP